MGSLEDSKTLRTDEVLDLGAMGPGLILFTIFVKLVPVLGADENGDLRRRKELNILS